MTLSSPTGGATLGSPSSATVTITDDDPTPTVQFSAASSSGSEATTPASISSDLSAASGQTVTVNYATANGTATAGSDYTATSETLTFNPGVTGQTISVPIINDTAVEGNEAFTVTLSGPVNATLGATATHTYTINDDDNFGTIQFSSATYSVNENGGSATITVTRTGGSSGAVGVSYATSNGTATAGSDYTSTSGTLSWANGDTSSKTFSIPILDDSAYEGNETVNLTLSSPTGEATLGSPSTAVLTIVDNDPDPDTTPPSLSITSHSNGQHVNTSIITLSGTASDAGKGDNGIQQVMVNGSRASNDTATGSGTANWSKSMSLSPGTNTTMVDAYDNSSNHNTITQSITIYYDTPLNNTTEFVKQQYRDFLNREADSIGLQYWVNMLNSGAMTKAQVIDSFLGSQEFEGTIAPIVRLYFAYFLRMPDYAGLMFWIDAYNSGLSLGDISDFFAGSEEFQQRYGSLYNDQFVTLVYQNVLGRIPDPGGLAFWIDELNSERRTRGRVMLEFSESAEYKGLSNNEVFVTMMYLGMLRRSPESGGFDYWVGYLDSGGSELSMIDAFFSFPGIC